MAEPTAPRAPRQTGRAVWRAADVADPGEWTWQLDDREIEALVDVGVHGADRSVATHVLADGIAQLTTELLDGRGFRLVRGFPIDDVHPHAAAAAFVWLGRRLGTARSQNAAGDLLGHVRNVGADASDPSVRIYQTNRRQTFHTDSSDVVGLMCLETAATGGASRRLSRPASAHRLVACPPT